MASSSGNSSGSYGCRSGATYSPADDGLMDEKKRKRKESNRESARRSRMRKQQHTDDLTVESNKIKTNNDQIRDTINVTMLRFTEIEAENFILRAQVTELTQRLNSLNEILNYINTNATRATSESMSGTEGLFEVDFMDNSWNMMYLNQPPIMANVFGY